ncbi:hypothetical protein J4Q44_G00118440 [Coregonus suidteri]|uniref:Uncharacterized protein n=1 Tax=Coregonus suidteri TaxID=861788 RepID=A0AAN8LTU4_9TELE
MMISQKSIDFPNKQMLMSTLHMSVILRQCWFVHILCLVTCRCKHTASMAIVGGLEDKSSLGYTVVRISVWIAS